jgi:hypothetical protein
MEQGRLYVRKNDEVVLVRNGEPTLNRRIVGDLSIKKILTLFIDYDIVDIKYEGGGVPQEALIKPILLKSIQEDIREGRGDKYG